MDLRCMSRVDLSSFHKCCNPRGRYKRRSQNRKNDKPLNGEQEQGNSEDSMGKLKFHGFG
ncbi:unnamed protein product [Linum tenue]|nr:unnamed protein product [Linum tenue]